MAYGSEYNIPSEIRDSQHSSAFSEFLFNWFEETWGLTRREVDLSFLKDLTEGERLKAQDILLSNLKLKYAHIIEGIGLVGDETCIPSLKAMLVDEEDLSWRLTISGALWRISNDESFVEGLYAAKNSDDATLKQAHFHQFLWLKDGRSVDILVGLLDDADSFVRFLAITRLNELEFGKRFLAAESELPHQADYYRAQSDNTEVREKMIGNMIKHPDW